MSQPQTPATQPLGHLNYSEFSFQPVIPTQPAFDLFGRVKSGDLSFETGELACGVVGCVMCLVASHGGQFALTMASPGTQAVIASGDVAKMAELGEVHLQSFKMTGSPAVAGMPQQLSAADYQKWIDIIKLIMEIIKQITG